ncbi:hypothetical protein TWF696_009196 [Orbilia brochopaga]|uniref:Uncharacterized protein n=1 Tax=Orbilia brochopaga TaxID=3140254 RepID=A0AAV9UFG4_9PEZI
MLSRIFRRITPRLSPPPTQRPAAFHLYALRRHYAAATGKRPVDEKVDGLSELYASAKDEFEIAVEETAKNSIYARDDRETTREELQKFKSAYEEAIASSSQEDGEEIKRRVGQRLRELESAVETLNEADTEEH